MSLANGCYCRGNCSCGRAKAPDGSLTFAEAMALDPSEVEVHIANDVWGALDKHKHFTLEMLRMRKFRRSRPKRSRVEEMAEATVVVPRNSREAWALGAANAVRAICEYLRSDRSPRGSSNALADQVEREFLEPR